MGLFEEHDHNLIIPTAWLIDVQADIPRKMHQPIASLLIKPVIWRHIPFESAPISAVHGLAHVSP